MLFPLFFMPWEEAKPSGKLEMNMAAIRNYIDSSSSCD
jgi:hypothetical protein